jgi:hypothetical protein
LDQRAVDTSAVALTVSQRAVDDGKVRGLSCCGIGVNEDDFAARDNGDLPVAGDEGEVVGRCRVAAVVAWARTRTPTMGSAMGSAGMRSGVCASSRRAGRVASFTMITLARSPDGTSRFDNVD